jgi:hypothetical protein
MVEFLRERRILGQERLPVLHGLWPKESEPCHTMNPKASAHTDPQRDLLRLELRHLVDYRHPLVQQADQIQWSEFESALAPLFCAANGRAACPVRLRLSGCPI